LFHVRPESGEPIYQQLIRQVKHAIATGALRPGTQLPSVRHLAAKLVVNPNTVARAYRELEHAGLVDSAVGRGSFVTYQPPAMLPEERVRRLKPYLEQLVAEARALGFGAGEVVELLRAELDETQPVET
jgi:GntR family transcriptional regulator